MEPFSTGCCAGAASEFSPFLLRLAEGLEFVDVLLFVDGIVRQDQGLADGPEGVFDPVEIAASVVIQSCCTNHLRSQLVGQLLQRRCDRFGRWSGSESPMNPEQMQSEDSDSSRQKPLAVGR